MERGWKHVARWSLLSALLVPLVAACGDETPLGPEEVTFAPALGVHLDQMTRLENGVYVQTLAEGEGVVPVTSTDSILANYEGWVSDGTKFDEQEERALRMNSVIPGFRAGAVGMVTGETRLMVIPSELGYGASPPNGSRIPPYAVLVFKVEVLEINPEHD